jgi:threonyl-tRNA synthetase
LLPERFKLTYKDKDNTEKRPIMIHVSAIGTYERFVAILLEQSKGKLPL